MANSRQTIRAALTTLCRTYLTGTDNPMQIVYGWRTYAFGQNNPVALVTSAGTEARLLTQNNEETTFYYNIWLVALYTDNSTWFEDDAEDALDLAEQRIREMVLANKNTADWDFLEYGGVTDAANQDFSLNGLDYRVEYVPLRVRVSD